MSRGLGTLKAAVGGEGEKRIQGTRCRRVFAAIPYLGTPFCKRNPIMRNDLPMRTPKEGSLYMNCSVKRVNAMLWSVLNSCPNFERCFGAKSPAAASPFHCVQGAFPTGIVIPDEPAYFYRELVACHSMSSW